MQFKQFICLKITNSNLAQDTTLLARQTFRAWYQIWTKRRFLCVQPEIIPSLQLSCLQTGTQRFRAAHATTTVTIWCKQDVKVWYSDSLLGGRRVFISRGENVKLCGMTLPQLELWDKGRWAWERDNSTYSMLSRTRFCYELDGCCKPERN